MLFTVWSNLGNNSVVFQNNFSTSKIQFSNFVAYIYTFVKKKLSKKKRIKSCSSFKMSLVLRKEISFFLVITVGKSLNLIIEFFRLKNCVYKNCRLMFRILLSDSKLNRFEQIRLCTLVWTIETDVNYQFLITMVLLQDSCVPLIFYLSVWLLIRIDCVSLRKIFCQCYQFEPSNLIKT